MAALILIGNGAHASDIRDTDPMLCQVAHHKDHYGGRCIIGINNPKTRADVAAELDVRDENWFHPAALIAHGCTFGYGVHVNYGVSMVRTSIGDHTTVSPGVTICGDVKIGRRCLIGAGATICDRVVIGDDVVIGAGAVVPPAVGIFEGTWVGIPATRIR